VVLSAVRSPSGELLGFAKVTRDLTERRRLDEERLQRARAEEALRMRDEFLSIASHELKTPLTSVKIELYGLKERLAGQDERLIRKIERATRNADRLSRLVETLLDVSRIANGKLTLRAEEFDLARALGEVVDGLRAAAAQSSCTLSFHTAGPVHGAWDRVRVEQVLMNLLSNAFKYGAGHPVSVAVAREGDEAVVEVKDLGPGVSDEDLDRIFDRFERAASMRNHGGLGLGLYVSREIVRAHGGCIFVRKAEEERGATFVVRLPRRYEVASAAPQPSLD
jgi:signal transduction histidine kinase